MQELYQTHFSSCLARLRSLNTHMRICCRSLQSADELQGYLMYGKTHDSSKGTEPS